MSRDWAHLLKKTGRQMRLQLADATKSTDAGASLRSDSSAKMENVLHMFTSFLFVFDLLDLYSS